MVRGVHIFLMAYTRRREQVIDFVNSCPEFVESLQYSDSYGLIQLKFVSLYQQIPLCNLVI